MKTPESRAALIAQAAAIINAEFSRLNLDPLNSEQIDALGDESQAGEADANAALIAAAPELLAALQAVCDSGVMLAEPLERAMLDALKKAQGAA